MIAQLDVLTSFAEVSAANDYVRPTINLSGKIILKDSRHPVVEALSRGAQRAVFVDRRTDAVKLIR